MQTSFFQKFGLRSFRNVRNMEFQSKLDRLHHHISRQPVFVALSFAFLYSFYNSYFRDFAYSPVVAAASEVGAATNVLDICMLVALTLGVVCCFAPAWQRLMNNKIVVKIALYAAAFIMPLCIPLAPTALLTYLCISVSAFCFGMIICRALYTVILASLGSHPARIIALAYIVIQAYLHAHALIPALNTLPFYYMLGGPTLFGGLFFCFSLDGTSG